MTVKGSGAQISANNAQQLLYVLRGADMTITTDQAFTKAFGGTNYVIQAVVVKRVSGAFGTACLGGIYDTAAKGGNALVAATQSYLALTGAGTCTVSTLAAIATTKVESTAPILSLTTGNTGALTADHFIFGVCVD